MSAIRVMLVDDHEVVGTGINATLSVEEDIEQLMVNPAPPRRPARKQSGKPGPARKNSARKSSSRSPKSPRGRTSSSPRKVAKKQAGPRKGPARKPGRSPKRGRR